MVKLKNEDGLFDFGFEIFREKLWHLQKVVHGVVIVNTVPVHDIKIFV